MKRWLIGLGVVILVLGVAGYLYRDELLRVFFQPTESTLEAGEVSNTPREMARDLTTPWSISFLPDGDMLVAEREGRLQRIGTDGAQYAIDGVRETSEGGLLGVALAPDFTENRHVYVYYTTAQGDALTNQVDRYTLDGTQLVDRIEIISRIPAANNHNGGALAFGPDDKLYMTTGDAVTSELAQNTDSLAGKILRLNPDGSIPDDNPYANAVWSYGHRNPQGIAWDDDGQLWSVEHGPSGAESGFDELNRIERGANYGWPVIQGDETREGMVTPVAQSGANETWAPAGLAYRDGSLYFAGLRGQSIYKVDISSPDDVSLAKISRLFADEYGRLRAVTAHDERIYFSTSNQDGRGSPSEGDDKIFRF